MNRRLICLSQGEFGLTGKITDPELWCEGFLFCCTDLIFSLSLSALRDAEVSMRWVGPRCNGCTLMESAAVCTGPQTTGPRHAEAGAREQNLRRVSLYAALQCSSVNRPYDAIGDPRVKTPVRCQECGDWVPGRSVSAAILQLGNGWRIGTFVGHRNVTKHSWPPLAGVLSPLSPGLSPCCCFGATRNSVQTSPVIPMRRELPGPSHLCPRSWAKLQFFGDRAHLRFINTHSSWLRAERVSVTGIKLQLWGKENFANNCSD